MTPTEWLNRVAHCFEYQELLEQEKVVMAAHYMKGKMHQWWQLLRLIHQQEYRVITWQTFEEELWSRFGPPARVDFNEALKKLQQTSSLLNIKKNLKDWRTWYMGGPKKHLLECLWAD